MFDPAVTTSPLVKLIENNIAELNCFAQVFHERIATAFDDLVSEAKQIETDEYRRISTIFNEENGDDSSLIYSSSQHGWSWIAGNARCGGF